MQSANTDAAPSEAADSSASARVAASSNARATASPSPAFLERFLAAASETKAARAPGLPAYALRFDHFMRLALYDPVVGYYAQPNRHRVGRSPHSDFYTATSVGQNPNAPGSSSPAASLFGELVVQSCLNLMGEAFCSRATFIEIGPECVSLDSAECMQSPLPKSAQTRSQQVRQPWLPALTHRSPHASLRASNTHGILQHLDHPFAAAQTLSLGQPIALSSTAAAPLIVFSNELFDAQPCRRFVWREALEGREERDGQEAQTGQNPQKARSAKNAAVTGWHELFVHAENGALNEVEHPLGRVPQFLPKTAPCRQDGYRIDAPLDAKQLLDQIATQPWHGLFLAFDYGKTWAELTEATPQGTARAYTQHRQSNALLAQPGQQDLTCHICWDWLQESLAEHGFSDLALDTQEAFFVKHAGPFIAQQIAAEARQLSPRKQALLQLLHPAHLGQKFQALSAKRAILD